MVTNNDIDTQCAKIREMLNDPQYKNHIDIEKALGIKRGSILSQTSKDSGRGQSRITDE